MHELSSVLPWPVLLPLSDKNYDDAERLHAHMRLMLAQALPAPESTTAIAAMSSPMRNSLMVEVVDAVLQSFNLYALETTLMAVAAEAVLGPNQHVIGAAARSARSAVTTNDTLIADDIAHASEHTGLTKDSSGEENLEQSSGIKSTNPHARLEADEVGLIRELELERSRLSWRIEQHARRGVQLRRQAQHLDELIASRRRRRSACQAEPS
eukprot:scaffold72180_cov31-Tisochrysis_lutea.AAC.3